MVLRESNMKLFENFELDYKTIIVLGAVIIIVVLIILSALRTIIGSAMKGFMFG